MARQYWRPSNLLYPVPAVMISCADEEGRSNIMTAAWAGTICSDPVMVSVSIRPERFSHGIISRTREFVINLTTEQLAYATDFCGVRSGRDIDKFSHLKLTKVPSFAVGAPSIGESPVCLECVVTQIEKLGTHDLFIAKVVQVSVDEQYLDESGRLLLDQAGLIAYVHGAYLSLGEKLGTFGFSVRKRQETKHPEVKRAESKSAGAGYPEARRAGGNAPGTKCARRKAPGAGRTEKAHTEGKRAEAKCTEGKCTQRKRVERKRYIEKKSAGSKRAGQKEHRS